MEEYIKRWIHSIHKTSRKKMEGTSNIYSRGKIYKIISDSCDKIYIGSTTEKNLSRRLSGHVIDYRRFLKGLINTNNSSFELVKLEDHKIILLENYSCNSRDELRAREQYYIEQNKEICVNKLNSKRDYKALRKVYEEKNRDIIREKYKIYFEKYKKENQEKIKERNRKRDSIKVNCEICEEEMNHSSLKRHQKRKHSGTEKKNKYNYTKAKCDICEKEMLDTSLNRHKMRKHSQK